MTDIPATTEERERAIAAWKRLRPTIAPPHMQREEPTESSQEAAREKLTAMVRHLGEPLPKLNLATLRALVRGGHGDFEVSVEDERRILAEAQAEREAGARR
jgi:hypothetical protein